VIQVAELLTSQDPKSESSMLRGESHGITQNKLDYICIDLELPKRKADLLGPRYQRWNILYDNMKALAFRFRQRGMAENV
jgi:hypothetical protein